MHCGDMERRKSQLIRLVDQILHILPLSLHVIQNDLDDLDLIVLRSQPDARLLLLVCVHDVSVVIEEQVDALCVV